VRLFLLYQDSAAEYHRLRLRIVQLEKQMMSEILRPERILIFLTPGRLVCNIADFFSLWLFCGYR
jgi:hypothetical protein